MPSFSPPLAHESVVSLPFSAESSNGYVQLTFTVTFQEEEDTTGTWEIWTDIPQVENGAVVSQPGDWHAVSFAPLGEDRQKVANGHVDSSDPNDAQSSSVIQLESTSVKSVEDSTPRTLVLTFVVPAISGRSYSYTYRRIPSEGGVQWLGGPGGNGFIRLEHNTSGVEEITDSSGEWVGPLKGAEELTWSGIGVEYDEKTPLPPRIVSLPTDFPVAPVLVFLHAKRPIHRSPFSRLLSGNLPLPARPTTHNLGIVSQLFAPLGIAAASALPSASTETAKSNYGFTSHDHLRDALRSALGNSQADSNRIRLLDVDFKSHETHDVSVLAITPSTGDPKTSYLIIYAPLIDHPCNVFVTVEGTGSPESPLAILCSDESKATYLPASTDLKPGRSIDLQLNPGTVSQILRVIDFVELRLAGGEEPIWLAAPDATSFEIGEEEIDIQNSQSTKSIEPVILDAPLELGEPVSVHEVRKESIDIPSTTSTTERVESVDETNEEAHAQDDTKYESPSWSLLDAIGHLFLNIWKLIFGILGSPTTGPDDSKDKAHVSPGVDNAPDVESPVDTHTPADETTPLLGSDTLSRATSSTAFSPLASPASTATAKLPLTTPNHLTNMTEFITTKTTEIEREPFVAAKTIEIRSYALATFTHAPPFSFLLPPGARQSALDNLRFGLKLKTEKEWENVAPIIKGDIGSTQGVLELQVGDGTNARGDQEWEVQIERV